MMEPQAAYAELRRSEIATHSDAAPRVAGIHSANGAVERAVEGLTDSVKDLRARLAPIIVAVPRDPTVREKTLRDAHSDLAAISYSQADRLEGLRDEIVDLLTLLDL